jgi:hypothetical protein
LFLLGGTVPRRRGHRCDDGIRSVLRCCAKHR